MSNIVDFDDSAKPDGTTIEDEAATWIAKIDRSLTSIEETEFTHWITSSALHYRVFMAMAKHWDATESYQELYLKNREPQIIRKHNATYRSYAVAACVLLGICISLFVFRFNSQPVNSSDIDIAQYHHEFLTTNQLSDEIQLPDGTSIRLNLHSKIKVSYSSKIRKLELLKGEFFVNVHKDLNRPLVVITKDRFIKAVGTEFNVELLDNTDVELTVAEGKVVYGNLDSQQETFNDTGKATLVSSGHQAILRKSGDIILIKSSIEIDQALAWKKGALVFNSQPLGEVLLELQRYHDYEFILENADMHDILVTGYFKANNLQQFLSAMKNNFGIQSRFEDGKKVILSNNTDSNK